MASWLDPMGLRRQIVEVFGLSGGFRMSIIGNSDHGVFDGEIDGELDGNAVCAKVGVIRRMQIANVEFIRIRRDIPEQVEGRGRT